MYTNEAKFTSVPRVQGVFQYRGFENCLGLFLIVFLLFFSSSQANDSDSTAAIELRCVDHWLNMHYFYLADLDGDNKSEIIRLFSDRRTFQAHHVSRARILSPALYQGNSVQRIESIVPLDIDSLPGSELAIVKRGKGGDSLWIEVISGFNKELVLCTTEAIVGKDITAKGNHEFAGWDGSVYSCNAVDLDDDGVKELVVPLVVGFDLYPRGIYVYSYPSGELRWWFPLAGNPGAPRFADANHDGFQEIYLKTWATSNGAVVDDRSDDVAYVFCLDHLGHPIWRQTLGDRFDFSTGNVHVCDCDKDGTTEIYYTDLARQEDYDRQVRVLEKHRAIDNVFIRQRSFDADQVYNHIYSADIVGDSLEELIVDGFIGIMRSRDLSPVSTGQLGRAAITLIEDVDGDADSTLELVLIEGDSLYVVDQHLNVLCAAGSDEGYRFLMARHIVNPAGQHFLGALATSGSGDPPNVVNIFEIGRPSGAPAAVPLSGWLFAGMYVLAGFVVGLTLGMLIKRKRKYPVRAPRTAEYENLLTSLASFDHGRMAGKNLNRLLFLFSNLPDSSEKFVQIRPNITAAVEAYQAYTTSQLDNVAQFGRRLKPVQSVIGDLISSKNRLAESLTRFSAPDVILEDSLEAKPVVIETLDRIQSAIRQIRKEVQTYFSADLLQVIPGVLIGMVTDLRQRRIGFRSITTHGGALRLVFFGEAELAAVFEELLANACDAMEQSEIKELSMYIHFGTDEAVIRLSDTGCGLQDADPESLFRRDYSTKQERGGYGLYHVQQQVERFAGRVRLYNNENGPGTTAELTLKTVNHA